MFEAATWVSPYDKIVTEKVNNGKKDDQRIFT